MLQVPEPDWLQEQFSVQSLRLHASLPSHCMVQPLPGHDRLAEPEDCALTVHPPAGHEKLHVPLPWHTNSQPLAGHARAQGSAVTQKHGVPGVQLVELVLCVVATQAAIMNRLSPRPTRRIVPPHRRSRIRLRYRSRVTFSGRAP